MSNKTETDTQNLKEDECKGVGWPVRHSKVVY